MNDIAESSHRAEIPLQGASNTRQKATAASMGPLGRAVAAGKAIPRSPVGDAVDDRLEDFDRQFLRLSEVTTATLDVVEDMREGKWLQFVVLKMIYVRRLTMDTV